MGFKFGNESVKRLELPGGEWVDVRVEVDRGTRNKFIPYMPQRRTKKADDITPAEAVLMQEGLFKALVTGWSAVDEKGKAIPPTIENYNRMTDGLDELDVALADHFNSMFATESEGKQPTTSA